MFYKCRTLVDFPKVMFLTKQKSIDIALDKFLVYLTKYPYLRGNNNPIIISIKDENKDEELYSVNFEGIMEFTVETIGYNFKNLKTM